jgi:hypothetical protein
MAKTHNGDSVGIKDFDKLTWWSVELIGKLDPNARLVSEDWSWISKDTLNYNVPSYSSQQDKIVEGDFLSLLVNIQTYSIEDFAARI